MPGTGCRWVTADCPGELDQCRPTAAVLVALLLADVVLAPDHLRCRYNALSSLMFSVAFVVGPVVASLLIGRDLGLVYIAFLVGGCALLAVIALVVERRLPRPVNGVHEVQEVPAASPATAEGAISG